VRDGPYCTSTRGTTVVSTAPAFALRSFLRGVAAAAAGPGEGGGGKSQSQNACTNSIEKGISRSCVPLNKDCVEPMKGVRALTDGLNRDT
jgi:hypothetical protein